MCPLCVVGPLLQAAATEAAALRKSNVTSDGDDKLRTGRSGGLKAAGKGGYKGGKPGAALKGGDGSEEFGAGGGAGLYGGGGGGCEELCLTLLSTRTIRGLPSSFIVCAPSRTSLCMHVLSESCLLRHS